MLYNNVENIYEYISVYIGVGGGNWLSRPNSQDSHQST